MNSDWVIHILALATVVAVLLIALMLMLLGATLVLNTI